MTPRSKMTIVTLGFTMLGMAGCSKIGNIYKEDNAQLALALNKNGSISVVGIGAGERLKPCKVSTGPGPLQEPGKEATPDQNTQARAPGQDAGKGAVPDPSVIAHCFPDRHVPERIVFQKTYTITVREGSLCMDVWEGSEMYVYCNPPDDVSWAQ